MELKGSSENSQDYNQHLPLGVVVFTPGAVLLRVYTVVYVTVIPILSPMPVSQSL